MSLTSQTQVSKTEPTDASENGGPLKVVVTDYIEDDLEWEREQLGKAGFQFECHQLKHSPREELAAATRDADIVVVNMAPIPASLIAQWKKCRLVIRHGIGYDNVDVDALTEAGIPLVNIPDYCVEEVAEHAITLIMNAVRKVGYSRQVFDLSVKKGQWDFSSMGPVYRMKGQTLGIIGCGRIGSRVLRKLRSFGFHFEVCDPKLSEARCRELDITPKPLREVLEKSDIVTLHAPLEADTDRMINATTLGYMKESAYIVNTARARLIDQGDLITALQEKRIAGAALDVFEKEPPSPDDPLITLESALLTPHLSWYSIEAGWTIRERIVEIVSSFAAGEELENCVNPEFSQRSA